MTAIEFRKLIDENGKVVAAQQIDPTVKNLKQADLLIFKYITRLLSAGAYSAAAIVLWGDRLFNPRPSAVRRIWKVLEGSCKCLIQGCGSVGKSYTAVAWILLDWWRDPEYTNIKILSATKGHARSNTFSTLVKLHRMAIVKMPGFITGDYIGLDPKDRKSGIAVIAIPSGDDGKGRLQGFHPDPRPVPHPILGPSSRVRALMDECEEIPLGVWEGVDNLLVAMDGVDTIKVIGAYNPKDQTSKTATNAEPEDGWEAFDLERGVRGKNQWTSKNKWEVLRIDGKETENVKERRMVYPGFMTYTGYRELELKDGGNSVNYYCADEETQVLSMRGWLYWFELNLKDVIYTLNPKTGKAEWSQVQEVFSKRFDGELTSMEGRGFSALVTGNHRWAVTNKDRQKRSPELVFKETENLALHDLIPLAAQPTESDECHSPSIAALVGWYVTDGTFQPNARGNEVIINQSITANPEKCQKIRDLLRGIGEPFTERNHAGMGYFRFSGSLGVKIRELAPEKKLTMRFIESLSNEGRLSLLDAIIGGDGGVQGGGTKYVCTNDEQQAGVYSALIARCGFAPVMHRRVLPRGKKPLKNGWTSPGGEMFYVNIRTSKSTRLSNIHVEKKHYAGTVWCPRTENGTFYARRGGTSYFTGNTFARGAYPPEGAVGILISIKLIADCKGEYTFIGHPTKCAGVDTAVDGRDNCVLTYGVTGLATAFTPKGGKTIKFKQPRTVIQANQQFVLKKGSVKIVGDSIHATCLELGVAPENLCVDATGNGSAVFSYLKAIWSDDVQGVDFNKAATEVKILEQDQFTPNELYEGIVSEVWFALARWMEFGFFAIAPGVRKEPLEGELTSRRYALGAGKKLRVEKKDDFKKRMGSTSPDFADSMTLFLCAPRFRSNMMGSMTDEVKIPDAPRRRPQHSKIDIPNWMDASAA